jgi:uncharacterized protein involved in exopolysaccharide biosynthesis
MENPAPPTPVAVQRATARDFFAVVFRRRWIILGLFVVSTITVVAVALLTPRKYVSSGEVLVRRGEQLSILIPERRVMNEWEIELGSEIQTVKSWPVLQAAQQILDEEGRKSGRIELDEKQVEADVTGKSNVLSISYVDRDPRVAQRVCDAVLRAYIDFRQRAQLNYPRRFFSAEITQATQELDRWTTARRDYLNQTGMVYLPEQRQSFISLHGQLEERRADAVAELEAATAQERFVVDLSAQPDADVPTVGQLGQTATTVLDIKRRVLDQQARIAALREHYQDDAPIVLNARVTLDTLRAILDREVESHVGAARTRVEVARARLAAANHDMAALEAKMRAMPDQEARIADLDQEVNSWRNRLNDLLKSSDQARVNENTVPLFSVFLLRPAGIAKPTNALDYVRLGLAPAFSLVVGVGLAFFVDGIDLTVRTSGQAEDEVQLPVLAAISERKRREPDDSDELSEKVPA